MAVSAAGAYAQKQASDRAVVTQAETANSNLSATYAANQEQSRQAAAQAFEQQTDRMQKASQQISMARVLAAQGQGDLASRAINITADAANDYSRIDTGLGNTQSSILSANAAGAVANAGQLAAANASLAANQTRFFSQVGSSAVQIGAMEFGDASKVNNAKNFKVNL